MMRLDVIDEIKFINKNYAGHPQCYFLALHLSSKFGGVVYYNHNHCLAFIDGKFYDYVGVVPYAEVAKGRYVPLNQCSATDVLALQVAMFKHKGVHEDAIKA